MKKVFVAFSTLIVVLVLNTVTAAKEPGMGFNCSNAKSSLMSCVAYLTGVADTPSAACCKGVKDVKSSATTKNERIAACKCLEEEATHIPNFKDDRAMSLPKQCGVQVGFPITKNFNCSSIP